MRRKPPSFKLLENIAQKLVEKVEKNNAVLSNRKYFFLFSFILFFTELKKKFILSNIKKYFLLKKLENMFKLLLLF